MKTTDTAIRPELLCLSRRAAAKVATDNIWYVQDFLEDEPSPDWLLVNGGGCTDLDLLFIHLFIYHYFIYAASIGPEAGYTIFMLRVR